MPCTSAGCRLSRVPQQRGRRRGGYGGGRTRRRRRRGAARTARRPCCAAWGSEKAVAATGTPSATTCSSPWTRTTRGEGLLADRRRSVRDLGLRPHVARYAKALKRDFARPLSAACRRAPHLSLLASQFSESEREWTWSRRSGRQHLGLAPARRRRARPCGIHAACGGKRVGLMAATDDDNREGSNTNASRRGRRSGSGDGEGGEDAAEEECLAASWNLNCSGPPAASGETGLQARHGRAAVHWSSR